MCDFKLEAEPTIIDLARACELADAYIGDIIWDRGDVPVAKVETLAYALSQISSLTSQLVTSLRKTGGEQ